MAKMPMTPGPAERRRHLRHLHADRRCRPGPYTLNDTLPAVQGMDQGDQVTSNFTVATTDGTEHTVTITINGTKSTRRRSRLAAQSQVASPSQPTPLAITTLVNANLSGSFGVADVDADHGPEQEPCRADLPRGAAGSLDDVYLLAGNQTAVTTAGRCTVGWHQTWTSGRADRAATST